MGRGKITSVRKKRSRWCSLLAGFSNFSLVFCFMRKLFWVCQKGQVRTEWVVAEEPGWQGARKGFGQVSDCTQQESQVSKCVGFTIFHSEHLSWRLLRNICPCGSQMGPT